MLPSRRVRTSCSRKKALTGIAPHSFQKFLVCIWLAFAWLLGRLKACHARVVSCVAKARRQSFFKVMTGLEATALPCCRQREALEEQLRAEIQRLQTRSASMAEELLQLREAKFGVDTSLLETSHRAASLEGTLSSLEVECESLRQKCGTAAMERAQSAAECAELRARLASAEEKVAAGHWLMQKY